MITERVFSSYVMFTRALFHPRAYRSTVSFRPFPLMKPPTRNRDLLQYTSIMMAVMLLSRVFGFLREWTVAHQLGSSGVTDTYYAAFTLPYLLSYLIAGGTIGVFFIPVFTKYHRVNARG